MSTFTGKRRKLYGQVAVSHVSVGPAYQGSLEVISNADKGILALPLEHRDEILAHYQKLDFLTRPPHDNPILPEEYLEYTDALRALSQVSVAYRQVFMPLPWETVNVCFSVRGANTNSFFKHVGEALARKCDGLKANPELRPLVKRLNIVLTRYRGNLVLPKLKRLLESLPNLTTLHLLHTHTQMPSALQETFEGVKFPSIRTLLIQGYCHHILPSCPNVKTLWCVRGDGQKLVPMIEKHCKSLEELHGFRLNEKYMKKLVKAVPNLRVFDMPDHRYQHILTEISHFKHLNTLVIITEDVPKLETYSYNALRLCIRDVKSKFGTLPQTKEKRKIRILYEDIGYKRMANGSDLPLARYGDTEFYEFGV